MLLLAQTGKDFCVLLVLLFCLHFTYTTFTFCSFPNCSHGWFIYFFNSSKWRISESFVVKSSLERLYLKGFEEKSCRGNGNKGEQRGKEMKRQCAWVPHSCPCPELILRALKYRPLYPSTSDPWVEMSVPCSSAMLQACSTSGSPVWLGGSFFWSFMRSALGCLLFTI